MTAIETDKLELVAEVESGSDEERALLFKLPETMDIELDNFEGHAIVAQDVTYVIGVEVNMELEGFVAEEMGTDSLKEAALAISTEDGDAGPPVMLYEDVTMQDLVTKFEDEYL